MLTAAELVEGRADFPFRGRGIMNVRWFQFPVTYGIRLGREGERTTVWFVPATNDPANGVRPRLPHTYSSATFCKQTEGEVVGAAIIGLLSTL